MNIPLLKAGLRLKAKTDHYPARAGAIGRIISLKGLPEKLHFVVKWERPGQNISPELTTNLYPTDLEHFEILVEPGEKKKKV